MINAAMVAAIGANQMVMKGLRPSCCAAAPLARPPMTKKATWAKEKIPPTPRIRFQLCVTMPQTKNRMRRCRAKRPVEKLVSTQGIARRTRMVATSATGLGFAHGPAAGSSRLRHAVCS